jgi:hypothetical protein
MTLLRQRQVMPGLLLGAAVLGAMLYLSGLYTLVRFRYPGVSRHTPLMAL